MTSGSPTQQMQNKPETCPASTIAIGPCLELDRVTQKFVCFCIVFCCFFFCFCIFGITIESVFLFHQHFKISIPWRNAQDR